MCVLFFFSSRRRHTRFDCDWSSDVCSSDLIVVLMGACAPIQRGRSYQESVVGGFDLKEWTVGRQRSDQNQRIVEFVRPGEKIDSWTELFTSQVLRKPPNPGPIDALVARVHADDAKLCPNGF